MENGDYLMIFVSLVLSITSITMLAACLCCRKKVQNNELLGLEGMVKIKNPDENLLNGNHTIAVIDTDTKISTNDISDSKRSLNVPHRSLPDIPVSDPNQLDTNSDLYATVGDKVGDKPQGQSPSSKIKKQISVSQHSSISQADDCSSPYARVRSPSHAYDKVRNEHPYAAVGDSNRPSTSTAAVTNNQNAENNNESNSTSRRSSRESLLDSVDGRHQQVIPAASAIAGRVSASQELPYMTPPIIQTNQYFSGDSQDSSKGYTSISVREPLANILAQTKKQNAQARLIDSHYATVSDDSDEMYAAIEDGNQPVDLYTSGSETYAQIQPQEPLVVSVEINSVPSHVNTTTVTNVQHRISTIASHPNPSSSTTTNRNSVIDDMPAQAAVDMLKAAAHSRQASESSCTSSVGNLGSPKPEKRSANSPLPPTPKATHQYQSNSNLTGSMSLQSGRSSVASVIEINSVAANQRHISRENLSADVRNALRNSVVLENDEPRKNRLSKDLEGMYAKVMKKNKLSNAPSENTSPVPYRKALNEQRQSVFLSDPDIAHEINLSDGLNKVHASPGKNSIKSAQLSIDNEYETIDKRRVRTSSSNYDSKNDPGYETIPADLPGNASNKANANRKNVARISAPPGMFLQKLQQQSLASYTDNSEPGYESLPDQSSLLTNDPGYETVEQSIKSSSKKDGSDYDPNYETLRPTTNADESADHYAKVWSKPNLDTNDGYSSISPVKNKIISNDDDDNVGYCTISNDTPDSKNVKKRLNHDYASIRETTKKYQHQVDVGDEEDGVYSSIPNENYTSIPVESENIQISIGEKRLQPSSNGRSYSSHASTPTSITLSPNTPMSTSICSTADESKTLTSPSSDSSSNTPIRYNSIHSTDRSQLTISISNYDSLTGSESDSNYESVRYLNARDRENPYEQLYNESDIKYDTLKRDDTSGSVAGLYALPAKNFSKSNSSNSSIGGSRTSKSDGKLSTSSSINLKSDGSDFAQV